MGQETDMRGYERIGEEMRGAERIPLWLGSGSLLSTIQACIQTGSGLALALAWICA